MINSQIISQIIRLLLLQLVSFTWGCYRPLIRSSAHKGAVPPTLRNTVLVEPYLLSTKLSFSSSEACQISTGQLGKYFMT